MPEKRQTLFLDCPTSMACADALLPRGLTLLVNRMNLQRFVFYHHSHRMTQVTRPICLVAMRSMQELLPFAYAERTCSLGPFGIIILLCRSPCPRLDPKMPHDRASWLQ